MFEERGALRIVSAWYTITVERTGMSSILRHAIWEKLHYTNFETEEGKKKLASISFHNLMMG